ncbi:MAG: type II toxin-antitoxin system prevent-host-death family antitoxin [Alphaproteobacteria bacterium]|nr:type II toxin-antitoxin system prevent-host-death family antitoxin [Alphaproteobacteria bacterium]
MRQVNLYEAKTNLSQLVEDAARGEEIVIAKNGKPMAKLVVAAAVGEQPKKRVGGQWAKLLTPEELAYRRSAQFDRDWKAWDKEIEDSFNVLKEDAREFDSKWPATSSTRMPSSTSKARRKSSSRKRSRR